MLILKIQSIDEMLSSEKRPTSSGDLFSSNINKKIPVHQCFWLKQDDVINLPIFVTPDIRETDTLFADISTFHPSISPLTAYTYVCSSQIAEQLGLEQNKIKPRAKPDERKLRLDIALILGEAITGTFLVEKDLVTANIGYAACTQTLAASIARASYLYPNLNRRIISDRWELARKLTNQEEITTPPNLVLNFSNKSENGGTQANFIKIFLDNYISENALTHELTNLFDLHREADKLKEAYNTRISVFNSIIDKIELSNAAIEIKSAGIAYFCNKILPGSMNHVASLKTHLDKYPDIVFWYMTFACLSPEFDIRNSMSGICYKLARDIVKPFSKEERPTCDISIDELEVISRVSMKASTLKPKRSRTLNISLLPGIDVELRLGQFSPPKKTPSPDADLIKINKLRSLLFEALDVVNSTSRPEGRAGKYSK